MYHCLNGIECLLNKKSDVKVDFCSLCFCRQMVERIRMSVQCKIDRKVVRSNLTMTVAFFFFLEKTLYRDFV